MHEKALLDFIIHMKFDAFQIKFYLYIKTFLLSQYQHFIQLFKDEVRYLFAFICLIFQCSLFASFSEVFEIHVTKKMEFLIV